METVINPHDMTEDLQQAVPSNLKPLLVLEFIADQGGDVSLTEVAEGLGLPKATVHRVLAVLESRGFLRQVPEARGYSLGERAQQFAVNALSSRRAQTARKQILSWLRDQLRETCTLVIPADEGMRYVDRAEVDSPLRVSFPVGSIVPFHCTASGKLYLSTLTTAEVRALMAAAGMAQFSPYTVTEIEILLSELEVIRKQGYALDAQEFLVGTIAIAVPILDFRARLSSILTVQVPMLRMSLDDVVACLPSLRDAAGRLEQIIRPERSL